MSVHPRRRVPKHRHLKSDVLEVEEGTPIRPAHKGVHALDVIIDNIISLDDTAINLT